MDSGFLPNFFTSVLSLYWNVLGLCSNFMLFTRSTRPFPNFLNSWTCGAGAVDLKPYVSFELTLVAGFK